MADVGWFPIDRMRIKEADVWVHRLVNLGMTFRRPTNMRWAMNGPEVQIVFQSKDDQLLAVMKYMPPMKTK